MNAAALERVRAKLDERVGQRTDQLVDILLQNYHDNPRRGVNLNAFGEHRSAPGDPAAEESGHLGQLMAEPERVGPAHWRVTANYAHLEWGFAPENVEPRPGGRIAISMLKAEV